MSHINIPTSFHSNETQKILDSYPFFGGTTPETTAGTSGDPQGKTENQPSGGTGAEEDPIKKLQSDPTALQQLLQQVSKQSSDLANVAKERDTLATEKEKQARAVASKEENLQKDLESAQFQIEAQHEVIVGMAKNNAFLSAAMSANVQFHSLKQAMAELDENNFSVDVNLDERKADVQGIENEVKRIAKDFPWLVKTTANNDEQGGSGRGPGRPPHRPGGTGAPPQAPKGGSQGNKGQRRDSMMNRFPVLMQGR